MRVYLNQSEIRLNMFRLGFDIEAFDARFAEGKYGKAMRARGEEFGDGS